MEENDVDLKKLHTPDDLIVQAKELSKETSASVAALQEFLNMHKSDGEWPSWAKAKIPVIEQALEQLGSAASKVAELAQEAERSIGTEAAASEATGKTFEGV